MLEIGTMSTDFNTFKQLALNIVKKIEIALRSKAMCSFLPGYK